MVGFCEECVFFARWLDDFMIVLRVCFGQEFFLERNSYSS